jgi:hypothetical protein
MTPESVALFTSLVCRMNFSEKSATFLRSCSALGNTIARAVHFQNVDMMAEAVEQGAGEPLGTEYAGLFVERQIADHDGCATLVMLAEDLEQQFGTGLRQRYIARFIDDQQLVAGDLALQAQGPFVITGLDQLVHEGGGGRDADRQTFLAGGKIAHIARGSTGASRKEGMSEDAERMMSARQCIRGREQGAAGAARGICGQAWYIGTQHGT